MSQSLFTNPTEFDKGIEAAFNARSEPLPLQTAALKRFATTGLPSRRREGWKWSDYRSVLQGETQTMLAAEPEVIAPSDFVSLNPIEVRIVNGRIHLPDEEMPTGVQFGIMPAAATISDLESHELVSLNVAMVRRALGLSVKAGVECKRPFLIRHINTGNGIAFSQTLMRVEKEASAEVIEVFEGGSIGTYSNLFHFAAEENSKISRTLIQKTAPESVVHSMCAVKIEGGVAYDQTSLSTGSRLSRHETLLHYMNDNVNFRLNSAALLAGKNHADFTTEILHHGTHCKTRQLHRGVAMDQGKNVFQGKFKVLRTAQKTDAQMSANALLLSDRAETNHKPELEIYADDVECAHGSTAGALDEEALFYMRQRGLSENEARALLVEAFVAETLELATEGVLKNDLIGRVRQWLGASS